MSALMTAVRFACRGYFGQIINSGRFAVMFENWGKLKQFSLLWSLKPSVVFVTKQMTDIVTWLTDFMDDNFKQKQS